MKRSFSAAVRNEEGQEGFADPSADALMLCTALFEAVKDFAGLEDSGSMRRTLYDAHSTDDPKGQSVLADISGKEIVLY